jgi:hypothetical protein
MRAREILSEVQDWNVEGMYAGQYGLSSKARKEGNQMYLGPYGNYRVWTRDLRQEGDDGNHEWEIEVITKKIPHPFVGKFKSSVSSSYVFPQDNIDDELKRKFDGPREYIVIRMDLKPLIMHDKHNNQDIGGSRVHHVQKVPEGVGSDINMVDFYIWIMNRLNTTMISDGKQSKGGASIWKRLASDPRVDVFAYSPNSNEFSQVDDEGDADLWDTWAGNDDEVVKWANKRRELGHPEADVVDDATKERERISRAYNNILFAVPSNKSKHIDDLIPKGEK